MIYLLTAYCSNPATTCVSCLTGGKIFFASHINLSILSGLSGLLDTRILPIRISARLSSAPKTEDLLKWNTLVALHRMLPAQQRKKPRSHCLHELRTGRSLQEREVLIENCEDPLEDMLDQESQSSSYPVESRNTATSSKGQTLPKKVSRFSFRVC